MNYSRQREAILSAVRESCCHPDADMICARVKEDIPHVSLGTVYRNDDNGYSVVTAREGRREITIVGTLPELTPGEQAIFTGEWVEHPQYGRQLRFEDLMPEAKKHQEEDVMDQLKALHDRYGLDFAGNLDKIFRGETLYRTVEYMRKHFSQHRNARAKEAAVTDE